MVTVRYFYLSNASVSGRSAGNAVQNLETIHDFQHSILQALPRPRGGLTS